MTEVSHLNSKGKEKILDFLDFSKFSLILITAIFMLSFDLRNEAYEADESSPLLPQEAVEKGYRCSLALEKAKIYSIFMAKVCLVTLTSLILLLLDSISDYSVAIKHFE